MSSPFNFALSASNVDTFLGTSLYSGLSQAEGIDLRIELHRILYGSVTTRPKGHWITYRRYDPSTPSDYFNKRTKEGVEGPAYAYTDTYLRTRRVPVRKNVDDLTQQKPGMDIGDTYVYYFEYTVKPKIGDDIFELDLEDHSITSLTPCDYNFTDRYKIKRVHPYRLESARIEYWIVVAEYDEVNY